MKPGTRVRIIEPGQAWHGEHATVIEAHNGSALLDLDKMPIGWRSRRAWFSFLQLRLVPKEGAK